MPSSRPLALALAQSAETGGDCFAAGTEIATHRGPVRIEHLHPGDRVCTVVGGDLAEVIWTGRRIADCARHPEPTRVWPVRIAANALGPGVPYADLVLSPGHAVYIDHVLIPIRLLADGHAIRQELTGRIAYHHIELSRHDVVLANGMAAESYLDAGDRASFGNTGAIVTLHPDFGVQTGESGRCVRLVRTGPVLERVRRRLALSRTNRGRWPRDTFRPGTTWPS